MKTKLLLSLFFISFVGFSQDKVVSNTGKQITVNTPATDTDMGLVKLAGDLGGSADAPTVLGLVNKWKLDGNAGTDTSTNFIGTTDANGLAFRTNNTDRVFISSIGFVGIGTTSPNYPLHVASTKNTSYSGYTYVNSVAGLGYISGSSGDARIAAYFAGRAIVSGELNVVSDARAKNIKGISNGSEDLKTIMKLEVTDYTKIDVFQHGNKPEKKLIAQQVEEYYPQAVSKQSDIIPDIYKPAESHKFIGEELIVQLAKHGLKKGDKVKLFFEEIENEIKISGSEDQFEVLSADASSFSIKTNYNTKITKNTKIFVYGREVDDFRAVDYDAISMLNVSATQELAKKVEVLEKEILELKTFIQNFCKK